MKSLIPKDSTDENDAILEVRAGPSDLQLLHEQEAFLPELDLECTLNCELNSFKSCLVITAKLIQLCSKLENIIYYVLLNLQAPVSIYLQIFLGLGRPHRSLPIRHNYYFYFLI